MTDKTILHLEEHYNFCSSSNIIRIIKSRSQITEFVYVGNTNTPGGLPEGKRPPERNVRTGGGNKMDFQQIKFYTLHFVHVAPNGPRYGALVNK
jgi:hypothetical protein